MSARIPVVLVDPIVESVTVGNMVGSKVVTIVEDFIVVQVLNDVGETEDELFSKVGVSGLVVVG